MAAELREIVSFLETEAVGQFGESTADSLIGEEAIQTMDSYREGLEEYYRMS